MKVTSASVAVAALSALVNGRNIDMPEATGLSDFSSDGFSPKPTLAAVGVHELLRRDSGPFNPNPANPEADFSYVVAPDNTCGYIGGRIGAGYTCNSIATCIFAMASQTDRGYLGCCLIDSTTTTCGYRAGCINSADYNVSCTDDGCRADPSTTKCTESTLPFCNTITFSEGVRDYWCGNVEVTTAQLASTTYRGENDDRTFSLLTDLGTDKSVVSSGSKTIPGPSITQGSVVSSASPTGTGGGGGGDDDDDHKKKTPVGAIVGGVVGGVAAIALVGLALFFLLRKKKTKTDPSTNNVPPPYHPPAMQQQPGTGPGGYNAVPQNQQTYYDPKHPYPSPGSQYVQPNSAVTGGFFPVNGQTDPSQHPTSPTVTDPRMSVAATSPSPSYGGYNTPAVQQTPQHTGYQQQQQPPFQPQQEVIHEAPANNVGDHRGQMHELA